MKEHQIIELLHKVIAENTNFTTWTVSTPHLVALVNHAVKQEREACAFLCDELWRKGGWDHNAGFAANCIRKRGTYRD